MCGEESEQTSGKILRKPREPGSPNTVKATEDRGKTYAKTEKGESGQNRNYRSPGPCWGE